MDITRIGEPITKQIGELMTGAIVRFPSDPEVYLFMIARSEDIVTLRPLDRAMSGRTVRPTEEVIEVEILSLSYKDK